MKYQVGDLLFVKEWCIWKPRPLYHLHPRLQNTYGIITAFEKHNDIFKSGSTEDDNRYVWLSQVDGTEYYFYEDEVNGEVVK